MYSHNNQIKFKASMLEPSLYYFSDAHIHVKRTIIIPNTGTASAPNNVYRKVIFKNCAPFTNYISETNNTQVDDAHIIDVIMTLFNLIEYSDDYLKTSES